jgi:transglutaminase-like putative cysteine protease
MTQRLRLTVAAAIAVLLASAALVPVYAGLGWLPEVVGAVAAVAAASGFARSRRVPALLQPVAGLLALAAYVVVVYARSTLRGGVLPGAETVNRVRTLLGEGLLDVEALAPPVPTTPGLVLLAVLGVGALAAVVDLVAVALARPATAGLPLLLLFAVPSGTVVGGVGWWPFALGAAGWLGLMLVEGAGRASRWGAAARNASPAPSYDDPGVHRVGRRIGAAALGVAFIVPALVPGLDARLFGTGSGSGFGNGSRSTTTYNPITELGGQLRLPAPRTLLTYRTDDPSPDYLRLTTLDVFNGDGWSSSTLTGTKDNAVSKGIPAPIGLDSTLTRPVTTEITVEQLDGPWLPVTFPPRDIALDGPWLWDRKAETVFSTRRRLQNVEEPYRVTATRVEPSAEQLRTGGSVPKEIALSAVAPPVTPYVRELTAEVVAGKTTAYDRVAALQAFFTDRGNGFRYSEEATVPGTNSPDALENFLRPRGRRGFCEQYASAMAAMVRVLGLPARVGVGFTPGERQGDGLYEVTTSDAHAWPEVWFPDAGWVRFEPTPRSEQVTVPDYTRPPVDLPAGDPQAAAPTPTDTPSAGPGGEPLSPDGRTPLEGDAGTAAPVGGPADDGSRRGAVALVLLAVLALLLLPRALAALRRRRRWADPSPAVAWAQVHDDAVDVGHRWRTTDSPRAAAAHLLASRPLPAPAAEALHRLAACAERDRYARPSAAQDEASVPALQADAQRVRAGLLSAAGPRQRWAARLLPASTLRWATSGLGALVADGLDRVDDTLAAIGRRLPGRPRRA